MERRLIVHSDDFGSLLVANEAVVPPLRLLTEDGDVREALAPAGVRLVSYRDG